MNKLIAICGFIGSGKGTVADILDEEYAYTKVSFADTLKDSVAAVFGWPRHMLEGDTDESRAWREQVDTWWSARLNMPQLTPRWVLQQWGTEVCRMSFHDDIWAASVENRIRNNPFNLVIPDCRFPNEIRTVRNLGGEVWWVRRGPDPRWYDRAINANVHNYTPDKVWLVQNVHASEWSWVGSKFDRIIENDGSLEQLKNNIKCMVEPA